MKKIRLALLLIVSLAGCKKENKPDPLYFQLDPEFLEYARVPEGTYYIYKDSATGQLDSVVVTHGQLSKLHHEDPCTADPCYNLIYDYDQLDLQMKKVSSSGSQSDWLTLRATGHILGETPFLDIVNDRPLLVYPFINTAIYVVELKLSVDVEGITYNNVVITTFPDHFTTYWAKGIGIIKASFNYGTPVSYTAIRHG